jgi:hypothetical protein
LDEILQVNGLDRVVPEREIAKRNKEMAFTENAEPKRKARSAKERKLGASPPDFDGLFRNSREELLTPW